MTLSMSIPMNKQHCPQPTCVTFLRCRGGRFRSIICWFISSSSIFFLSFSGMISSQSLPGDRLCWLNHLVSLSSHFSNNPADNWTFHIWSITEETGGQYLLLCGTTGVISGDGENKQIGVISIFIQSVVQSKEGNHHEAILWLSEQ